MAHAVLMMGSDQYCLKWNNHWGNLVRVFNSLRHSETFVDVTLACEGQQLKAHRLVLSACSPYFRELLVSHPDRHPIVILKDVRFSELQSIVQFIYNGEISVDHQDLPSLLSTAKELQIRGLADNPALIQASSTNFKPNLHQPTNPPSVLERLSPTSREGSPASKRRKTDQRLSPDAYLQPPEDCHKDVAGPSGENENKEKVNGDCADEKENLEPQVDIKKQPKDKPPDVRKTPSPEIDIKEIDKVEDNPDIILSEEDTGLVTTNGTSSPPIEAPISSTTPQVSFLQQALAMGLQQPLHFLQKGSPPPLAHANNLLNFVDLLKAVGGGVNLPAPPQMHHHNTGGRITPGLSPGLSPGPGGMSSPRQNLSPSSNGGEQRNPLTCHICARIMPSMQVLEEHVRIHEEEKPYKCEQCGQRYKYQSAFQRHQEQNHTAKLPGDKPYRCEVCGQCFKYHKSFTKHRANHDLLDNFLKTEPGEEKSSTIRALQETYLQRLLTPQIPPESIKEEALDEPLNEAKSPCLVSSTSIPVLENGEIKEEDEDIDIDEIVPDVPDNDEEEGKFLYCTNCKLTFRDIKGFDGHCRLSPQCSPDTLKEVAVGGDISVTSVTSQASSPDTPNSSSGGSIAPPGMLYMVGGYPPQPAPTILNLSKFVNIHHNGGTPSTVPSGARSSDSLYNMSGCTPIAPAGVNVNSLLSGLEDERPFKCPYCQKGFKGRENLKLHIRTHTGEKPYNCGVCGKAFGGRSDMNRHLRIHTGEKPYPCKVCGKKFARADYLSKHITTHLGIPFAKPVHSLQQSLQNLENMHNLQNLESMQNSVNTQSLFNSLQSMQLQQNIPGFQGLQSLQNLHSMQHQTSVPSMRAITPTPTVHNNKEEIPNLSK